MGLWRKETNMLAAYYYPGCASTHAALDLYRFVAPNSCVGSLRNARREHIETIEVSGKREARKIAKERNARPWNF
ncbi:hypothetical protein [Sphingomonas phage Kimi]|nr:hypothetical protein [Sphingomonas phage Kimi]